MAGSWDVARKAHPGSVPGNEIEVLEKNTDTSWAAFQALHNQHERGFEKTQPAVMHHPRPAASPATFDVDAVVLEARRNNRVCPHPLVWQRLYDWLPNKVPQLAQVPTTRAEWDQVPPLEKRSRLREHIEWAAAQGVLHKVHDALRKLPEERWHHIGE